MGQSASEAHVLEVPAGMTDAEWAVRVELAAAYRLAARWGWTDLNNTHFSARVPGTDDEFLLNPFGLLFDEITASSLIKVDKEGNIIGDSDYPANPAGFVIHGAIHTLAPQRQCGDSYSQPLRHRRRYARARPAASRAKGFDPDGVGWLSRL